MKILSIETSCDETSASVTEGRKILSNVIFSQVDIHKEYGGVYPSLARREHEKKIEPVIKKALKNAHTTIEEIDAIAVTFGPGLVIALEVGLRKAKELAKKYHKILIPVDHIEGHMYSAFAQNSEGNPERKFSFPFLALVVSGGHTNLILVNSHLKYQILGKTLDDAAGEALDKAAKMMGIGYPGGPIIEKLAEKGNPNFMDLPIPLQRVKTLNFSYSGLKTAFRNKLEKMKQKEIVKNLPHLCASFQETVFISIIKNLKRAIEQTRVKHLVVGGGVMANKKLRRMIRKTAKTMGVTYYQAYDKKLYNDNAAMIGIVAHYKHKEGIYLKDNFDKVDRVARPSLKLWTKI